MAEASEIYDQISENSPQSAEDFRVSFEGAIDVLREDAHIFDAKHEEKRYLINHYKVTLVFKIRGEEVTVGVVAHQRRKPGYWKGRF